MSSNERRQGPRDTTKARLGWLSRLRAPILLTPLTDDDEADFVLRLRTDLENFAEFELTGEAWEDWQVVWAIIGCLVSQVVEQRDFRSAGELLEAARWGLDAVLEVRIRQLQQNGLRA